MQKIQMVLFVTVHIWDFKTNKKYFKKKKLKIQSNGAADSISLNLFHSVLSWKFENRTIAQRRIRFGGFDNTTLWDSFSCQCMRLGHKPNSWYKYGGTTLLMPRILKQNIGMWWAMVHSAYRNLSISNGSKFSIHYIIWYFVL